MGESKRTAPTIDFIERKLKPSDALQSNRLAICKVVEAHRACNASVFGSVIMGVDTAEFLSRIFNMDGA